MWNGTSLWFSFAFPWLLLRLNPRSSMNCLSIFFAISILCYLFLFFLGIIYILSTNYLSIACTVNTFSQSVVYHFLHAIFCNTKFWKNLVKYSNLSFMVWTYFVFLKKYFHALTYRNFLKFSSKRVKVLLWTSRSNSAWVTSCIWWDVEL